MKAFGQITLSVVNDGEQGLPGTPALNVVIANEAQSIPCTNSGLVSKQLLLEIPFAGYEGFQKVACDVSVGLLPPGMSHTAENATPDKDGLVTLNISKGADLGGSDVLTGTIPLTFAIKGNKITKQFSWTKTKDGAAGSAARIYSIEPSTLIVKKMVGDKFSPDSVTFSSFYKDGNSVSVHSYSGRFIVERSTNGTSFDTVYTSGKDEKETVYNLQKDDTSIRATLCASGGITEKLDFQTVTVLSDGSISTGGVNLAEETNRGDRNWKWQLETGDYTTESVASDNVNCAKLIRGTKQNTGFSYITYEKVMPKKYKSDEDYMISFDIKSNVSTTISAFLKNKDGSNDLAETYENVKNEVVKDTWTQCVFHVHTKAELPVLDKQVLYLSDMDSNPETYYMFKNLQIERGTVVTDWKTAPEDVSNGLPLLESTIVTQIGVEVDRLEKQISAKLSEDTFSKYVDETGKTIQGLQTQQTKFEASLGGIQTEVSNVQSTLATKADGSKVQALEENVSSLEQSANKFQSTVEKTYLKKSELSEELKKNATFAISLTNDDHTIPADSQGNNGNYSGCETTVSAVFGSENVTSNCVFTQSVSDGVTGSWNNATHTYTVTNMTSDTGYVDITGKYTISISGQEQVKTDTKRFVLSKRKEVDIQNTVVYTLQSSDIIIKKLTENTFDPKQITFSAFSREGTAAQKKFNGAFQISESVNGNTFTQKYFSEVKQSEVVYTPRERDLTKIQCILYKDLNKEEELDRCTISVIPDATVDIGCRNLIRNSKTMMFESYGFVHTSNIVYSTDENGNILTDENGNRFIY